RVECATNQQINALIPSPLVRAEWLYWVFTSPLGQDAIRLNASATTLPILNKSKFERLPVPLPPRAEQDRIVAEVEDRFSIADAVDATLGRSLARSTRLRQAVLRRAFEGALVPQESSDEPASKLLERIHVAASKESEPKRG